MGKIVGRDDPVGAVVKDDVAGANIETANDVVLFYLFIAAVWISAARLDAIVIVIPVGVVRVARIVPALVLSIVVAIVATLIIAVMFLRALVFAMIVGRQSRGRRMTGNKERQAEKNCTCEKGTLHDLLSPSGD